MKLISNIFILTILILLINGKKVQKPLHILVLYESLCPDSVKFFRDQLEPSYDYIKNYVDIHLVPFGKSNSINNGIEFQCQHGPPECEGNRMQSCVLNEFDNDQDKQVQFAICQMSGNADPIGKHCGEIVGIQHDSINYCINSRIGTNLQLEAEFITQAFEPSFVPTIIYQGVFDQQLQDRSQSEFLSVVCGLLKQKGIQDHNLKQVC